MIETSIQNHFLLKCVKDHPINEKLQVDFISLKFLHCEKGLDLLCSKEQIMKAFQAISPKYSKCKTEIFSFSK